MNYFLLAACIALFPVAAAAAVHSSASATAQSGGNYAGPGGVVHAGASSASVQVTSVAGSGSSTTHIRVEANGIVHEEDSSAGRVEVRVDSTPHEAVVGVKEAGAPARLYTVPPAPTESAATATTTATATAPAAPAGLYSGHPQGFIVRIFEWIGSMFNFWR